MLSLTNEAKLIYVSRARDRNGSRGAWVVISIGRRDEPVRIGVLMERQRHQGRLALAATTGRSAPPHTFPGTLERSRAISPRGHLGATVSFIEQTMILDVSSRLVAGAVRPASTLTRQPNGGRSGKRPLTAPAMPGHSRRAHTLPMARWEQSRSPRGAGREKFEYATKKRIIDTCEMAMHERRPWAGRTVSEQLPNSLACHSSHIYATSATLPDGAV